MQDYFCSYSLYKPGQAIGSIHLPLCKISPSGQKQPAAHPPGGSVALVLPHIRGCSEAHC